MNKLQRCFTFLVYLGLTWMPLPVSAQAVWSGGEGNWTDSNWAGGSGPGGQPGANQEILLPLSTGQITVVTNLTRDIGRFGKFTQEDGTLKIATSGSVAFGSDARLGVGPDSSATWNVSGRLGVSGDLEIGFGSGDGQGNALGVLSIEGAARIAIDGNMDTWWDDGARLSITGGNASIEVGGTFILGTAATMTANINSDEFSTIRALTEASFPGGAGTLDVNFIDGYVPNVGASWLLFDAPDVNGLIPIVSVPDTPKGTRLTVNYGIGGQHGEVVTLDYTNTLNLRVDSETGQARIENPMAGDTAFDIDGYIIRSESRSLDASGFNGVGQAGWLPGLPPSQSSGLLSETSFEGSLAVKRGDSFAIGSVFKTAGATDLNFEYRLTSGETTLGTVEYATVPDVVGDFNKNGILDTDDIDDLTVQSASGTNPIGYDLNGDAVVNAADINVWVRDLFHTWIGDANLDGEFNSTDIIIVLASGTFETDLAAVWSTGDFDGDLRSRSSDLIAALADGGFQEGPRAGVAAVPEPSTVLSCLLFMAGLAARRRKSHIGFQHKRRSQVGWT